MPKPREPDRGARVAPITLRLEKTVRRRFKLGVPVVLAVALFAAIAIPAGTAFGSSGCNIKLWDGICQDPNTQPLPMHPCPDFTDRHLRNIWGHPMYDNNTGYYGGYLKVRASIPCKRAEKIALSVDALTWIDGWYWTASMPLGGTWQNHNGAQLNRGVHFAQTNWQPGQPRPAPIYREGNQIVGDWEQLRDCTGIRWASERKLCYSQGQITRATYRNVKK